jgi:hypothetical protein
MMYICFSPQIIKRKSGSNVSQDELQQAMSALLRTTSGKKKKVLDKIIDTSYACFVNFILFIVQ